MTDHEALIRAREAVAAGAHECVAEQYRNGSRDHEASVQAALYALRTLNEPLPVDRDLADMRELFAAGEELEPSLVGPPAAYIRAGEKDCYLRSVLPTFRAIIQRRIEEAGK